MKLFLRFCFILPAVLLPLPLHASDMSGLVYLVIIWPLGIFLSLTLIILLILTGSKLRKREYNPRTRLLGRIALITALLEMPLFSLYVFTSRDAMRAVEVGIVSVLPVILLGLLCLRNGLRLMRASG